MNQVLTWLSIIWFCTIILMENYQNSHSVKTESNKKNNKCLDVYCFYAK